MFGNISAQMRLRHVLFYRTGGQYYDVVPI